MKFYTDRLSAEQLIKHIARDPLELSFHKVQAQRDYYRTICQSWLLMNVQEISNYDLPLEDDF